MHKISAWFVFGVLLYVIQPWVWCWRLLLYEIASCSSLLPSALQDATAYVSMLVHFIINSVLLFLFSEIQQRVALLLHGLQVQCPETQSNHSYDMEKKYDRGGAIHEQTHPSFTHAVWTEASRIMVIHSSWTTYPCPRNLSFWRYL